MSTPLGPELVWHEDGEMGVRVKRGAHWRVEARRLGPARALDAVDPAERVGLSLLAPGRVLPFEELREGARREWGIPLGDEPVAPQSLNGLQAEVYSIRDRVDGVEVDGVLVLAVSEGASYLLWVAVRSEHFDEEGRGILRDIARSLTPI